MISEIMKYAPTIGLEIHAELKTRTKMFCDSLNDPDEKNPNTNVCPVCLGHPGTLPTINKQAVEHVIRVGLALGGKVNPKTKFDRKNYFYPDLPKGYQISQYDVPLVEGGELLGKRIRRIHLEEDAGTLGHEIRDPLMQEGKLFSLVDFNRAGVPLMELVTEPDFTSAEEVVAFARELQLILRYLGASDADMEKGLMRIEANVSLNMGTKTELKNINSFKFVSAAIAYELKRQEEALEKGEKLVQETRGWDEAKQKTFSQRSKEEAHDYRYFPEPDLPPFETAIFGLATIKEGLPELPAGKRARFAKEYGLNEKQVDAAISEPALAEFFEESVSELKEKNAKASVVTLFNYLTMDLRGLMNEGGINLKDSKIDPEHLAHLVLLIEDGKIGSRQAKDILKKMFDTGLDPEEIVQTEGLETVSDTGELEKIVKEVLEKNPKAIEDYKKGKTASLQFLVGQAMGHLRGRGNPEVLREIFKKEMGA